MDGSVPPPPPPGEDVVITVALRGGAGRCQVHTSLSPCISGVFLAEFCSRHFFLLVMGKFGNCRPSFYSANKVAEHLLPMVAPS